MTNCFTFLFCFSADNRCSVGQPRSHCVGRGSAGVGDDYDAHSRWRRVLSLGGEPLHVSLVASKFAGTLKGQVSQKEERVT